jgi:uncharacterized membrane protein
MRASNIIATVGLWLLAVMSVVLLLVSVFSETAAAEYIPDIEIIVVDDETGEPVDISDLFPELPVNLPGIDTEPRPQNEQYEIERVEHDYTDLQEQIDRFMSLMELQHAVIIALMIILIGLLVGLCFIVKWSPDNE